MFDGVFTIIIMQNFINKTFWKSFVYSVFIKRQHIALRQRRLVFYPWRKVNGLWI